MSSSDKSKADELKAELKAELAANSASASSNDTVMKHFVADGGVPYVPSSDRDPFEALDDLMCVVEALTPTWPPREPMKEGKYWLL